MIVLIGVYTWKAREGGQVCVEGGNWSLNTIYTVAIATLWLRSHSAAGYVIST